MRRVLLAVAVLLTGMAWVPWTATPAGAVIGTVMPADASGLPNDAFISTDALFALAIVDIEGGRICVVPALSTTQTCDDPGFGEPNIVFGIGTQYTLLEGPSLRPGNWKLRAEVEDDDGNWLYATESDVFTVSPCVGAECASTIGAEAAQRFKDGAQLAKDAVNIVCLSYATSPVQSGKGAKGRLKKMVKNLDDAVKEYDDVQPSFGAWVGAIGGGLGMTFLPQLSIPTTQRAMDLLKEISCRASLMYRDIVNDPPDPDFTTLSAPVEAEIPLANLGGDAVAHDLAVSLDRQEAFGVAALDAYERYQGALAAGDQAWVQRQARAAADNADALVAELRTSADALRAHADQLAADPAFAGDLLTATERAQLVTVYQRIATTGFLPAELAQLASLGYTPAEIEILRTHFDLPVDVVPTDVPLADVLRAQADELERAAFDIDAFAREAAAVADNDEPPVAGFLTESVGDRTVRFTSTSTSPDGDPLTITWAFGDGQQGAGPIVDHTFESGGTYTVTVTAHEPGNEASSSQQVVVTSPVATTNDDLLVLTAGSSGVIAVLANDVAPPGQTLAVSAWSTTSTAGGSVTCTAAGTCTYAPQSPAFVGDDAFTYTAQASGGSSDEATVAISVQPQAPTAAPDEAVTTTDVPVDVDVLTNDVVPPGATATVGAVSSSAAGALPTCSSSGSCTYTPPLGFAGFDQFSYQVVTDQGTQAWGLVTVVVNPVAIVAPTVVDDDVTTQRSQPVDLQVLANDTAPLGHTMALVEPPTTSAGGGTVSCDALGACSYTPPWSFVGTDQFLYRVEATNGARAVGIVTVEVIPPPPPSAADDVAATPAGVGRAIDVLANDVIPPEIDGAITIEVTQPPDRGGSLTCSYPSPCTYQPPPWFKGSEEATYAIVVDSFVVAEATVTVTVQTTPPSVVDDVATGWAPLLVVDVLANDQDADGDTLAVHSATQPANGSVSCPSHGVCTYIPDEGFVGADQFTYRARGIGGAAGPQATVVVAVQEPVAITGPPRAVDDELTVIGSAPGAIEVTANDEEPDGEPLSVTSTTDPAHGTASCEADGSCTYIADDGYVGWDLFRYEVTDGSATDQGMVAVRVADPDVALTPVVAGAPIGAGDGVRAGESARWTVGLRAEGPLAVELAGALDGAAVAAALAGAHSLDLPSVTTAPGWAWDVAARTSTAGTGALLGDRSVGMLDTPLPPISQGTGGDGHVPILVGDRVFAFFHHQHPTQVTCVDRTTGQVCPGYPKVVPAGASNAPGPAVISGDHLWVSALFSGSATQSAAVGLLCWDTAGAAPCGVAVAGRVPASTVGVSANAMSHPVQVGSLMWTAGPTGRLHCFSPTTGAACAVPSVTTGLPTGPGPYDIVTVGSQVFVGEGSSGQVACLQLPSGSPCAGWATPKVLTSGNLLLRKDASGSPVAVCGLFSGSELRCVSLQAPGTIAQIPVPAGVFDPYYGLNGEAEVDHRTFLPSDFQPGMRCWDWAAMSTCTDGDLGPNGIGVDGSGAPLPSSYGVAYDGTCLVGLGDPGQVFTVDPRGVAPCAGLFRGAARRMDLRDQRCDGTVGAARWSYARLLDTDLAPGVEFQTATVLVRDAETKQVLRAKEVVGTSGQVYLGSIDPAAHPSIEVIVSAVSVVGDPAWADADPPEVELSWIPDPASGCFETTTVDACSVASGESPLAVAATRVGSADPAATATLELVPDACAGLPGPPIDVSGIGADASATVRWEPPLDDGGSPIVEYELEVTPGLQVLTSPAATRQMVVTGLANGVDHTFRVRARNAVGWGPWSAPSNVARPRPSCAGDAFSDVGAAHPFCPEITWMADEGIASGYPDGTYRPTAQVTRQAMAAFVYRLSGSELGTDPGCAVSPFPDVPTSHDFCGEIAWMKDEGIASGYADGGYHPGAAVSRQAMSAFLYRLTGSSRGPDPTCVRDEFTDVTQAHPFCGEIDWMVDSGLAGGYADGSFHPTEAISRQAMAAFLFRYELLTGIVSGAP